MLRGQCSTTPTLLPPSFSVLGKCKWRSQLLISGFRRSEAGEDNHKGSPCCECPSFTPGASLKNDWGLQEGGGLGGFASPEMENQERKKNRLKKIRKIFWGPSLSGMHFQVFVAVSKYINILLKVVTGKVVV